MVDLAGKAGGSVIRSIVNSAYQEQNVRGRELYALESQINQSERDLKAASIGYAGPVTPYSGVMIRLR